MLESFDINMAEHEIAFQTAVALTMDEEPRRLIERHLQDVMKITRDFRVYMEQTRKMDDRKRAQVLEYRYDTTQQN